MSLQEDEWNFWGFLHLQYKSQQTLNYTIDLKKEIILFFGLLYNIACFYHIDLQSKS